MNTRTLKALLEQRRQDDDWTPELEALASLALTLAATLDTDAGSGLAAVAREYRATIALLSTKESGVNDAFDQLAARLSAQVEHR
jgi:hypothetical protein